MIEIGYTCPEDVTSMPKTSCGHFCSVCTKEVHDFRGKSNDEIKNILDSDTSIDCGIFDSPQIKHEARNEVSNLFRIAFAAIFIFGFNFNVLFAQPGCDFEPNDPVKVELVKHDTLLITGMVKDAEGNVLEGATINYTIDQTKYSAKADSEGKFKLQLVSSKVGSEIQIVFSYPGMDDEIYTIEELKTWHYKFYATLERRHYVRGYIVDPTPKPGKIKRP